MRANKENPLDHYPVADIIKCMRISATMLRLAADNGKDKSYTGQANLLEAAADDLEARLNELELPWA